MKIDHKALFPPGPHRFGFDQLEEAVLSQPGRRRREELWQRFAAFLVRLQRIDCSGLDIWLDGSFMSAHPDPSDVDAVLWVPMDHADQCSDAAYTGLQALKDRPALRQRYGIDLYLGMASAADEEDRWARTFGTCHDGRTLKGWAILTV